MSRGKKTKVGKIRMKESAKRRQDVHNKIKNVVVGTSRVKNNKGLRMFRNDDLQEVRECLQSDDLSELPAILGAVILGHFHTVKRLLSSGTNVDARWVDGSTPLHWAVQTQNIEMAGLLIARGANPAVANNNKVTPILVALTSTDWDQNAFMDLWNLVKTHPEMSYGACDSLGNTLLHLAVQRQWTAFVEMLLEKNVSTEEAKIRAGARIICEDALEQTPFCYAVAALAQHHSSARVTLQHLIDVFNSHHDLVCVEDYLKRRLEILLNLKKENRSMEKGILMVLEFFLRQFEMGLEVLLELNIFYKIRRSLEKRISSNGASEVLGPLLRFTSALLLRCGCCGASVATRVPADAFITTGMANLCLQIIDSKHESNLTLALTPIALSVGAGDGEGPVEIWLRLSFSKLLDLTKNHFNDILNVPLHLDEYHKRVLQHKLQQYHTVISEMEFSGSNFSKDNLNYKNEVSITSNGDNENKPCKLSPIVLIGYNKVCQSSDAGCEDYVQNRKKCNAEIDQGKLSNSALTSSPSKKVQRKLNRHLKQRNARQKRDLATDKIISTASASTVLIASPEGRGRERDEKELPANSSNLRLVKSNPTSKTLFGLETDSEKVEEILVESNELNELTAAETAEDEMKQSLPIALGLMSDYNLVKTSETNEASVDNDANSFIWNTKFSSKNQNIRKLLNKTKMSWKSMSDLTLKDEAFSDSSENVTLSMSKQLPDSLVIKSNCSNQQDCDPKDNITKSEGNIEEKFYSLIKINDNIQKIIDIEEKIISLDGIFRHIIQRYEYHWRKDREEGYPGFCGCCGDNQFGTMTEQLENFKVILPKIEEDYLNRLKEGWHNVVVTLRKNAVVNPIKCKTSYSELESILKTHKIRGITVLEDIANEKYTSTNLHNQISDFGSLDITDKNCNNLLRIINESLSIKSESELLNNSLFLPKKHDSKSSNNKGQKRKEQISTCSHSEEQKPQSSIGQNHSRWRVMLDSFVTTPWISTGTISMAVPDQRAKFIISAGGNFGDVEMALGANGVPLAVKHIPHQAKTAMQDCLQVLPTNLHPNLLIPKLEGSLLSTSLCEYNIGELLMCLKLEGRCVDLSALARQLLVGLVYLHRLSIVHGNLKPSNALVDEGGLLKLSEFGMHKVLYQLHQPPKSSMIWFAKETLEEWERSSSLCCDTRSDIQVAGMLVHFLLSGGRHPLGMAAEDILRGVRGGREPAPVAPPALAHLLGWMLAPSPQRRPTALQALGLSKCIYYADYNMISSVIESTSYI